MKTGYLLIADILGFSNIIKNVADRELNARIEDWTKLVKTLGEKYNFRNYQLLSDTLFLSVDSSENSSLERLISYSQDLLSLGLQKFIPIKGAISYGNYEWSKSIYGKAVIDAHEIESSENWIGISLISGIPRIEKQWSTNKVICYPTPMKSGRIQLFPVVAWDVPNFDTLVKQTIGKGLTKEGDVFNWSWAEKIKNTLEFKFYLDTLKRENQTGEHFFGMLPIQSIELNLTK